MEIITHLLRGRSRQPGRRNACKIRSHQIVRLKDTSCGRKKMWHQAKRKTTLRMHLTNVKKALLWSRDLSKSKRMQGIRTRRHWGFQRVTSQSEIQLIHSSSMTNSSTRNGSTSWKHKRARHGSTTLLSRQSLRHEIEQAGENHLRSGCLTMKQSSNLLLWEYLTLKQRRSRDRERSTEHRCKHSGGRKKLKTKLTMPNYETSTTMRGRLNDLDRQACLKAITGLLRDRQLQQSHTSTTQLKNLFSHMVISISLRIQEIRVH